MERIIFRKYEENSRIFEFGKIFESNQAKI